MGNICGKSKTTQKVNNLGCDKNPNHLENVRNTELLNPDNILIGEEQGKVNEISMVIRTQVQNGSGNLSALQCEQYGLTLFDQFYLKKIRILGNGAFGEVWMSMDIRNHELSAVKYIKEKSAEDQDDMINNIASFIVENEMLEKISRKFAKSVTKFFGAVYSLGTNGQVEHLILALESGDYSLLEQLIAAEQFNNSIPCYSSSEVLAFVAQICSGYKALQELRIYHSDTKIANIVFSRSKSKLIIIDFGVSKFLGAHTTQNKKVATEAQDPDDIEIFSTACLQFLDDHKASVLSVALSPDGKIFMIGGKNID